MQSTLPSQGVDTKKEDNLSIVFFGAVRRGLECRTEVCVITERVPQSQNAERKYTTEVMSSGFCLCASSPTRSRSQATLGARTTEEVTPHKFESPTNLSEGKIAKRCVVQSDIVNLHTKWRYEQHAVDAINIALAG